MIRLLALLLFVLAVVIPGPVRAEVTNCTNIASLPVVISTQGKYCLKQDLSTAISSGSAITVLVNNVTVDCNDWKIGGLAGGTSTTARGIYADGRLNVTIRNCGIRGFSEGIYLADSAGGGHLIENNRLDFNTNAGIYVRGDGSTIRANRVSETGGRPGVFDAIGIDVRDNGDVLDNTVSGVAPAGPNGSAIGIKVSANAGGVVAHNRVSDLVNIGAVGYRAYAIWANGGSPIIRDNSVHNGGALTADDWGIACNSSAPIARDNVVHGFSAPGQPVGNCTSVGNTTP